MTDINFLKAKCLAREMSDVTFDRNQYAALLKNDVRISLEINGVHYSSLFDDDDNKKLRRLITDAINRKIEHNEGRLAELQQQFDTL